MDYPIGRELFLKMANDMNNLILFTNNPDENSLSNNILNLQNKNIQFTVFI